jgi:outer membrane biosynthesis protein TonB
MFRFLAVASLLVAFVSGQCPATPPGGCSVCGAGRCVGNSEAIFVFPGQPEVACGLLEEAGYTGAVPLDQCGFLAGLIGVCECGTVSSGGNPLPSPTLAPAPTGPSPTKAPAPTGAPPTTASQPTRAPVPTGPVPTKAPVPSPVVTPTRAPVPTPSRTPSFVVTPTPAPAGTTKPSKPKTGKKSGMGMMGMMGMGKRRALEGHILARRGV